MKIEAVATQWLSNFSASLPASQPVCWCVSLMCGISRIKTEICVNIDESDKILSLNCVNIRCATTEAVILFLTRFQVI